MRKIIRILLLLAYLLPLKLLAQTLNLNQFQVEDGLPQSCIYTLTQDQSGAIWIGTMDGVSCYNGLRFENFSYKDSMAEHRVTASGMDDGGGLWFGHWAGRISYFNPKTRKFSPVTLPNSLVNKQINCIAKDNNGKMLFASNGDGLLIYTPSQDEIKKSVEFPNGKFEHLTESKGNLPSNTVYALFCTNSGITYLATSKGVWSTKDFKHFNPIKGLENIAITAIIVDKKNQIWVGTEDQGLYKITNEQQRLKHYTSKDGLSIGAIKCLLEDPNGNIFVGTYGGGVSKYIVGLEANGYQGPVFQTISSVQGLSNDKVFSLLLDREKNIWIGTALNLNQYFDEQFELFGQNEGLKNSLIWSVIEAKNGSIWLGTEGGLTEVTKNNQNNQLDFENQTANKKGAITNTTALFEDDNGAIWFTNYGNGASKFDPKSKQTTNYTISDGLPSNEINSIIGDSKGTIWLATNNGLASFDLASEKFTNYKAPILGSNKVYTLYFDQKGILWIGCLGGNLTAFDGHNFKVYGKAEGYDNEFTISITEDLNHHLWFGSFEKGIFQFDGQHFKNYSTKEGASSNQALMLIADRNNLWIGNNQGIDKFNIRTETFKHYGRQDGFLGVEINPNSALRDKEGNLWFGSIIGIVKYRSAEEKTNLVEPILKLGNPRLFYKSIEIRNDHRFSFRQNHFTFDFSGASLTNPKRVKYKYFLEGYDHDWSPAQRQNFATYSNLPAGHYIFKVKASNNDDIWNKEPAEFEFTILPPFWKTIWFWTLIGIFTIVLAGFYVRYREMKLRAANQLLEEKVLQRTEELRKEKAVVERQNQNIKDSIDYAQRIQEAVFVPQAMIEKLLPDFFILFKPKDVVSGDFYWVNEIHGKVIFAMADCTGHGVPGAFMSIIGYNLLNNAILTKGIFQPSLILDELSKEITNTLSANESGQKVKDGMDIAICSYDPKTRELQFAGAHNSMYHVRNGSLTEYKADKQPVGKSTMHDAQFRFTNRSIVIEKGDSVYLFTDGYADSIGGPKKTKFYYPPFRQALAEGAHLQPEEQRRKLENILSDWLGEREQVDDIAVMGIRF